MFNMFPGKLWGIFKCSSSRIHDLAIASHLIYSGKEWELWVIVVGMPLSLIQHLSRWYLLKKPIENFEIIYLIFYLIYCLITYWHDHRENIKWYLQKLSSKCIINICKFWSKLEARVVHKQKYIIYEYSTLIQSDNCRAFMIKGSTYGHAGTW